MTGLPSPKNRYRSEPADARIVVALDEMTLIYQRRSGITHIVADPVPQILEAMGAGTDNAPCDPALIAARLAADYDLGDPAEAQAAIAARLAELAELGLVALVDADIGDA